MTAAPRRPRPVADAPRVDAVVVAKAWLVDLITAAPLELVGAVPAADLARGAPALVEALLEAVASDAALDRLRPGGDRMPLAVAAGRLAGAVDPAPTVAALDALRGAAWRILATELRDPEPAQAAELADRLAHVCSVVCQSALTAEPAASRAQPETAEAAWGEGASVARFPQVVTPLRVADESTPWDAAIDRRLARHADDRRPFAVLIVEVDDLERLVAAETGREVASALEAAERGLTSELAPADVVVRERLGRYWLTSPDSDQQAARDLGERVAAAIGHATLAGVPLTASVGLAICPDDGLSVQDLAARADEGVFAARAAGLRLA